MGKTNPLDKITPEWLKNLASRIKDTDLDKIIKRSDEILAKVGLSDKMKGLFESCKVLVSMVKDYKSGAYREIPWWAVSAVAFALLYVLSPIDLIPDFIPVLGMTDDALVVMLCLKLIGREMDKYRKWKGVNNK